MKPQTAEALRSLFLSFFQSKGHAVISSASLIPENDPTVLFTTAGMHPLVPYLLGMAHPAGKRLTDVQKCIRTSDIDEVGDASHLTFFEMLGNWSLGDYFKKEAIEWSWEFLTSNEYLGLDPEHLAFSVFAGDENAPRDDVSYDLWRSVGVPADRIFYLPKENNWWGPAGLTGPCGPDTEMFIITRDEPCGPDCSPACGCGRYLEIWNDVFMQYNKQADGSYLPLQYPNVDTGMGVERTLCVLTGKKSVYETDLFSGILHKIGELTGKTYLADETQTRAFRIIADHLRSATFLIGDPHGVTPSNVDQGYILRRLIRRAVRFGIQLGAQEGFTAKVADVVITQYGQAYPELTQNADWIKEQLLLEEARFARTLKQGEKEFEKILLSIEKFNLPRQIDGKRAFKLYDTYGFPIEMTVELAKEHDLPVDVAGFEEHFKKHQQLSQTGSEQRFKGGLADSSVQTSRLHTATHLMHAGLQKVLGKEAKQKGSNITAERLRFDFSFGRKMTDAELCEVEKFVNEAIEADVPIVCEEMTVEEAAAQNAIGLFGEKYGEKVKVYTMGAFSKEICGGPHASHTGELKSFKIQKEESSSAGVRRIKATIG